MVKLLYFRPWNCPTMQRKRLNKHLLFAVCSVFSSIFFWSAHVKFLRRKYAVCGLTRPQQNSRLKTLKYVTVAAVSCLLLFQTMMRTTCDTDAHCSLGFFPKKRSCQTLTKSTRYFLLKLTHAHAVNTCSGVFLSLWAKCDTKYVWKINKNFF